VGVNLRNLSLSIFKVFKTACCAVGFFMLISMAFGQELRPQSQANFSAGNAYPNKSIKFVVPFIPGSLVDVIARSMAEELQRAWKVTVVVENKAGASTLLAAKIVANAPPDGYTLFFPTVTTFSMAPQLIAKPGIDPAVELLPIARLAITNFYLTVHPSFPAKNMREWIEAVRKNPGKYSYASSGNGSPQHIFMEILKKQLNLDIVHIPYKGSNSGMLDLLSGKVDMSFIDGTLAGPNTKSGALIALGSSMSKRSSLLPSVPPISESVPGYDWSGWLGFASPANLPQPIADTLSDFIRRYQATAAYQTMLEKGGVELPDFMSPAEMALFIQNENKRWAPAIKASGATVD